MSADMEDWGRIELALYNDFAATEPEVFADEWVQLLYDNALFDYQNNSKEDRIDALLTLKEYLLDNYSMDFDDVFDWEAYRVSYDNNQV